MHEWLHEYLIKPAEDLLSSMSVGDDLRDLEPCRQLCTGIEGVFRDQVGAQFAAWPRGSTTDGLVADICVKSADRTLVVMGRCWFDFGGRVFPVRAEVILAPDATELALLEIDVGRADDATDVFTTYPAGSLILPVRDDDRRVAGAELLAGHRAKNLEWSRAVFYPAG